MANSTIRIYNSFTEVRQNVKTSSPHQIYFPQDLYNQIMPGSINLEGVKITSTNAILKENDLEGKLIHIKKDSGVKTVQMIRSRDTLVQDLETLRYFHVDRSQIEYSEIPEETGTEVTFTLEKEGLAVLSYLMYGITWNPKYSLNINGEEHTFEGWAHINNATQKNFTIEKTEILGGDVNTVSEHVASYGNIERMCVKSAPSVVSSEEVSGLYMYSINDTYTLAPRSTFSLPFSNPSIELRKVALMQSNFCNNNNKGQSSKVYRIKSDKFLPSGTVTIREDGRVVGQASLSDLSANENCDLNVGNDPEVSYTREVTTVKHEEDQSEYSVKIKVKNNKTRVINFEFVETFYSRFNFIPLDENEFNIVFSNDYIKAVGAIKPNTEKSFSYKAEVFNN